MPLLAQHFVGRKRAKLGSRVCKIPQAVMERLITYPGPGNVRELENVIERALILSPGETLCLEESFGRAQSTFERPERPADIGGTLIAAPVETPRLEESFGDGRQAHGGLAPGSPEHLAELERARIRGALEACGWKVKGKGNAAERLGFKPSTLRDRMKKLGIVRPDP